MPLVPLGLSPFTLVSTSPTSPFWMKLRVPLTELPLAGASTAVADCFLLKKLLPPLQPASSTQPPIKIQTDFIAFSRAMHGRGAPKTARFLALAPRRVKSLRRNELANLAEYARRAAVISACSLLSGTYRDRYHAN